MSETKSNTIKWDKKDYDDLVIAAKDDDRSIKSFVIVAVKEKIKRDKENAK